jgi:hypothetical protein
VSRDAGNGHRGAALSGPRALRAQQPAKRQVLR